MANGEGLAALERLLRADLNFHGTAGTHATHGWHPFPAKFPPQLPAWFIEGLTAPGDVVLDPMFGSGTTILEAVRLRRRAVGCDIDPLARLLAQAKLTKFDPVAMLRLGTAVLNDAQRRFSMHGDELDAALVGRFDPKTKAFVDYWFPPLQQRQLVALLEAIERHAPRTAWPLLHMVFSSTIIAKSGGVSLARDLAHTRPHRVLAKKPKSAFDEFGKRLKLVLGSASGSTSAELGDDARIIAASAEDTGLAADSIDLVVTSPPYTSNAIDYMRAHKFSLVWLGWKIADLTDIRARYLGHDAKDAARLGRSSGAVRAHCRSSGEGGRTEGRGPAALLRRDVRRPRRDAPRPQARQGRDRGGRKLHPARHRRGDPQGLGGARRGRRLPTRAHRRSPPRPRQAHDAGRGGPMTARRRSNSACTKSM